MQNDVVDGGDMLVLLHVAQRRLFEPSPWRAAVRLLPPTFTLDLGEPRGQIGFRLLPAACFSRFAKSAMTMDELVDVPDAVDEDETGETSAPDHA